jgi:hypothetical protein
MSNDVLTVAQVAAMANMSEGRVRYYIRDGRLPVTKETNNSRTYPHGWKIRYLIKPEDAQAFKAALESGELKKTGRAGGRPKKLDKLKPGKDYSRIYIRLNAEQMELVCSTLSPEERAAILEHFSWLKSNRVEEYERAMQSMRREK